MNYRHAFHAGNFADLVKHATLLLLLERLTKASNPLLVVDTHAGAGAYDLRGEAAARSGEAQAGIVRLMADSQAPLAFASLKQAVRRLNGGGGVQLYPGSPLLIAGALRPTDQYLADTWPANCGRTITPPCSRRCTLIPSPRPGRPTAMPRPPPRSIANAAAWC